jgi:hypothetical protein
MHCSSVAFLLSSHPHEMTKLASEDWVSYSTLHRTPRAQKRGASLITISPASLIRIAHPPSCASEIERAARSHLKVLLLMHKSSFRFLSTTRPSSRRQRIIPAQEKREQRRGRSKQARRRRERGIRSNRSSSSLEASFSIRGLASSVTLKKGYKQRRVSVVYIITPLQLPANPPPRSHHPHSCAPRSSWPTFSPYSASSDD